MKLLRKLNFKMRWVYELVFRKESSLIVDRNMDRFRIDAIFIIKSFW